MLDLTISNLMPLRHCPSSQWFVGLLYSIHVTYQTADGPYEATIHWPSLSPGAIVLSVPGLLPHIHPSGTLAPASFHRAEPYPSASYAPVSDEIPIELVVRFSHILNALPSCLAGLTLRMKCSICCGDGCLHAASDYELQMTSFEVRCELPEDSQAVRPRSGS